uniref:ShKT domain-containing protein n=1 Tax=Rhabditophanes sp. KR3021 TaxID=114890 RepID=A0AC35TPB4_9BILA
MIALKFVILLSLVGVSNGLACAADSDCNNPTMFCNNLVCEQMECVFDTCPGDVIPPIIDCDIPSQMCVLIATTTTTTLRPSTTTLKALTTTKAGTTTTKAPTCAKDIATNCVQLKTGGYCSNATYASLMATQCATSCCGIKSVTTTTKVPVVTTTKKSTCVDLSSNCVTLAASNYCTNTAYAQLMSEQCRLSCKMVC